MAGVLVDRWDRRRTMIACDVVRGLLVLAVPFAFEIHIGLVYLMAFLISTVTLLFRPAKTAVVPAIVKERDLVAANSAMAVPETAADLIGYPVAGLIVTALSAVIGAAFALDAVTYVLSAVLIWSMVVPRQVEEAQEPMSDRIGLAGDARGIRVPLERASASLEHASVDDGAGGRGRRDRRQPAVRQGRGRPRQP